MPADPQRLNPRALTQPVEIVDSAGTAILAVTGTAAIRLGSTGGSVAFYGTTPVAKQPGVAVTAQGLHDALVALGLIAA